jgi:hypothetical protein
MDDLVIAFVMRCDEQGLDYEAGLAAAERLVSEIEAAAEDRAAYTENAA